VYSVETNEHIFKIVSPSGSHTSLVFSILNVMAIFLLGRPYNWGKKMRLLTAGTHLSGNLHAAKKTIIATLHTPACDRQSVSRRVFWHFTNLEKKPVKCEGRV